MNKGSIKSCPSQSGSDLPRFHALLLQEFPWYHLSAGIWVPASLVARSLSVAFCFRTGLWGSLLEGSMLSDLNGHLAGRCVKKRSHPLFSWEGGFNLSTLVPFPHLKYSGSHFSNSLSSKGLLSKTPKAPPPENGSTPQTKQRTRP